MLVADVKCYHCGFISGQVVSENGQAPHLGSPLLGPRSIPVSPRRPRCTRCGGPVFLDDLRRVHPPRIFDATEKPRRGRPRRSTALAER